MERRDRGPGTAPGRGSLASKRKPVAPGEVETYGDSSPANSGSESGEPERAPVPEPSEDFAERQDIETANEPAEQHDRRHHNRGDRDVESSQPV